MNNGVLKVQKIIAQAADDHNSTKVEKDIPLEVDIGNFAVFDHNSIDDDKLRYVWINLAILLWVSLIG